MISVLILTFNEEVNLRKCLDSLSWCKDIVILDSFSTDQTKQIAESFGAKVFQRDFDDYASQRNFGLNKITYQNSWVLMVDADEEVPLDLANEIKTVIGTKKDDICLYRMRRKDFFLGRWLRRSSGYPIWFGRLMKIGHTRVERTINEEYKTDGGIGFLSHHLHHYPFNKGFAAWFEKHNRYSTMEAAILLNEKKIELKFKDLFSPDPTVRRRFLKRIAYNIPFRPFLIFCYLFVFRLGFVDGVAGFTYCRLRSIYEYMIDLKIKEIRRRSKDLHV